MNQKKYFIKFSKKNNINSYYSFNYYKFSNKILYKKYSSLKYSYPSICINNLIFNEKCRLVSRFKDYLFYDDDTEFLKISYEKEELQKTLVKVIDFYERYNQVFPNYMILPENIFMYKNLRKKQKMIDEINKMNIEKEMKSRNLKRNRKNKKNIKESIYIFDEKIKENINRLNNSMQTINLTNTIISNCININDNKKKDYNVDDNNSFVESNTNNISFSISLYTKRSIFNKNDNNNNNQILYDDNLKSESSLKNIVDVLNNKNFKKINFKDKLKRKKINKLNIDIFSNDNNNYCNNNNNNILTNHLKTQSFIIKTPTKKKFLKKEKDLKQIYQFNQKTLNNNKTNFNHKKNISDFNSAYQMIKSTTGKILSKKKSFKCLSKFRTENNNNIIEEITSSLIGKSKSKQRNKKKIIEGKNLFNNSKKVENFTVSHDKYERFSSKFSNFSKEKKYIKVNAFKRSKKFSKTNNNHFFKLNNKNMNNKKRKIHEEEKNNNDDTSNRKNNKTYEMFKEKYKSNFNNEIKEKRKMINKLIIETNLAESTKISKISSFNNRKNKINFLTNEINSSNNQICLNKNQYNFNNEAIYKQSKEENICNFNIINTFNSYNFKNVVNNTDNNFYNKYTLGNNSIKINKNQNKMNIENRKLIHIKHKTLSSHIINNNFYYTSYGQKIEENKINLLKNKLKKIKEEILKGKNNFKEIKEKFRKLSENNQKKLLTYPQSSGYHKVFEKANTCSVFKNNSVEKKLKINRNSNSINKHNELISKIKIKSIKKDKNVYSIHLKNDSIIDNNYKSPLKKRIKRELAKDKIRKSKDKVAGNKSNNRKIKYNNKN